MENITNIHLRLLWKKNSQPVTGTPYSVKLFDRDFLKDDPLGESALDANGHAIVSITRSDFRTPDSFSEQFPDVYFVLSENGKSVFRSKVFKNLQVEEAADFPASGGLNFNLGTFVI